MMDEGSRELISVRSGVVAIHSGLLGATGATGAEAQQNRLLEIERRILAIEARFSQPIPERNR